MPGDRENQVPESPQTSSSSTQQSAVLISRSGSLYTISLLLIRFQTQLTKVLDGENDFVGLKTYSYKAFVKQIVFKRGLLITITYVGEIQNNRYSEDR